MRVSMPAGLQEAGAELVRDRDEQRVADRASATVVDLVESVQVDHQVAASLLGQEVGQLLLERPAVAQARHVVVQRHLGEPGTLPCNQDETGVSRQRQQTQDHAADCRGQTADPPAAGDALHRHQQAEDQRGYTERQPAGRI